MHVLARNQLPALALGLFDHAVQQVDARGQRTQERSLLLLDHLFDQRPLIFGLFTRMHLVEMVASGIPRMQEAMQEAKLPEPELHTDGMFTGVFKRKANSVTVSYTHLNCNYSVYGYRIKPISIPYIDNNYG